MKIKVVAVVAAFIALLLLLQQTSAADSPAPASITYEYITIR